MDTGLAKEILAKSQQSGTVIPSNIFPGSFIQFAADNNDLNEETLDGKRTTHATTLVVYQKKPFGPMPPSVAHADHSGKERSLERTNVYEEILECSAQGKRPAVKDFLGKLEPGAEVFTTTDEYKSSYTTDLTWAVARLSPMKLFTEEDPTRGEDEETIQQTIPSWSGYNSLVFPNTTLPTVIGYCPMINGSSTEFSTVYTVMKKAQNMCASLDQKDVVVTFDLAIYCKAKQIMWKYPDEFHDTLIRLGGFHIALNFLAVLGKRYQSSGIEDVLIESGTYGPGTVTSLMKGKSYNRGVRGHKVTMEALFRLMWQAFLHWLNAEGQRSHKENVEEKHLVDSMKSFHLALKSKDSVPQRAVSITQELKTVMELFETFQRAERARSPMFAFWEEYIRMVIMLLQFVKAERTGNWCLHLAAVSAMAPYFFAHDRQNYSRWLPIYLADMGQLEQKHPEVYQRFMEGEHAISRSSQPFARVWTDMALEQSINLDSKSKGGIVGISLNADALQRWFLTSHERAAITSAVKQMCGINDLDQVGTHKEAAPKRVERDENDVRKIVSCFKSGLMKDPFSEESDSLSNIATGVVLPTDVAERLMTSVEKGQEQMNSFIQQRLNSNDVSFWHAIPSLKIKTFSSTMKKTTIKGTNEKLVAITEDRDLFGRLLIVSNARQVNLREILCFELSSVPYSLAHTDGTLRKTTKSVLLQILENDVTVEPRLTSLPTMPTVYILDGMALVQMLRFSGASNFGKMAANYFEFLMAYYQQGCHRLDVVFDQYWQLSIKAGERKKRGEASALEVRIHGASTPVPKQFQKYISNAANKVSLSAFLTEAWVEMAKHLLPADKELVIGGGTTDGLLALSIKNGHCHEVPALDSDHEEADTRMLLHAQNASQDAQRIIQSPDTDVLLLCVTHYDEIGSDELWFRTGVKDRLRYIPAHKIVISLGPLICKALPAFHSLTGCDSTSALSRMGKKKAWKSIIKNKVHQESLAGVGQSPDVDEETVKKAEAFMCSLYTIKNRIPATADEARYLLFCQKAQNNLLLPPTSDSLLQHIKRANYQAYVWRKALVSRQDLPSPAGHGWKIEDNAMCPHLMTKPPAPANILELTNCQCSTSLCTRNCSCSSNGLACTEACRCMADDNCHNPNKACDYDSDDYDDLPETDIDDYQR